VHASTVKPAIGKEKQWIKDVVIVTKKNRDFEYFSTIWRSFSGGPYLLNQASDNREQRYVLGIDSGQNFSGVYAVILLDDSLKNLMGHGTLTVEYVVCNELRPRRVIFPLVEKAVADDRQILVHLDASHRLRKKIVAWKVTIREEHTQKEWMQSSFLWKKLMP
jgi:hypothetical protein